MMKSQERVFDKYDTSFLIFGKFEFNTKWTLKQTIEKLKEYGLRYSSDKSWGDLVTYRVWIYSDEKYNETRQADWEFNFVSINPNSEMIDVFYDYPNSADVLVKLRKYHQGWFRDEYNQTKGITLEIKSENK